MSLLTASTLRRLQQLPQLSTVWEGDRRPLQPGFPPGQIHPRDGICILWVDGSEGVVRLMDIVSNNVGLEGMVRTLLQAMESPHGAAPARPSKIVVRDREVQFYLRGVLQELEIKVEFQPELPLIDEIYQSFQDATFHHRPSEEEPFQAELQSKAFALWGDAPWDYLADHQVLAIELKHPEIHTLYASVMGMLGMEYGIIFYRSLESLQRFRAQVIQGEDSDHEEAFLHQDCFFLTFAARDPHWEDEEVDLGTLPPEDLEATFGTIHPLEGLRPFLYEEEALPLTLALEALHRFLRQHKLHLQTAYTARKGRYRIPQPEGGTLNVQVQTLPELAESLLDESAHLPSPTENQAVVLHEDLIPAKSHLGLGMIPWQLVEYLRQGGQLFSTAAKDIPSEGDGLPVVIVQTSRPKAKVLMQQLQQGGGPMGICFNTGVDPLNGVRYDLEIMQLGNGDLHLLAEFPEDDPTHSAARQKWDRRCKATGGYCGLVVAMGITTARREDLQLKHMMGLYILQSLSPGKLGLGPMVRLDPDLQLP